MSLATGATLTLDRKSAGGSRTRIVQALGNVDGLVGHSSAPDVATAGAAWPRWVGTAYSGHLDAGPVDTFDVLVSLPADYTATTVDDGDQLRDACWPQLRHVAHMVSCEPVGIAFPDGQSLPGLRFRVTVTR